jgi:replicative DNA helicase
MEKNRTLVIENLKTIFQRQVKTIESRTAKPEFNFGIKSLDEACGGIPRGKLTLFAARTSTGKTALASQLAFYCADNGKTVAFLTLEDDKQQMSENIFCNFASIDNRTLKKGAVPQLYDKKTEEVFENLPIMLIDRYGYTFEEIISVVEGIEPKPDIVFLDYVQIIDRMEKMNRYETLSEFTRLAKLYAEEQKIAFVITCQINRAGARETGRPSLHHLSGCDALEQNADLVLILHMPFLYGEPTFNFDKSHTGQMDQGYEQAPRNWIEIEIAKNKHGERALIVPLKYTGRFYKFEEWDNQPVF